MLWLVSASIRRVAGIPLKFARLAGLVSLLFAPLAAAEHLSGGVNGADARLKGVLEEMQRGKAAAALEQVDRLIAAHPNFRLAHLVRGDLLQARMQPLKTFGSGHNGRERFEELRAEALARVRSFRERPAADRYPRYLLELDRLQKHVVVVDSIRSRVYLYENARGVPHLVADYYTTIGKRGIGKTKEGDQKTPVGVYYVTSSIPGSKLPDLYGWGAFPINYPNAWDRIQGRTGFGIWLHGVPADTYARAPQASDGCVALANPDIEELAKRVQVGTTPVIIANEIEWLSATQLAAERDAFRRQLDAWRTDWESRDAARYLAHYATQFRSDKMDLAAWAAHKRKVNADKNWISIGLSNVSIFRSPGSQELMVVSFDQDYRSSNLVQRSRKRQYWLRETAGWKMVYEGPTQGAPVALPESYPGRRR